MDRQFYDVDVQTALSSGDHSVSAMVQRAERLGFDGLVISDYIQETDDVTAIRDAVDDVDTTLDVRVGSRLRPEDGGTLKDMLQQVRDAVDVVVVHGGDISVNRAACGDTRVDVLAHPELQRKDPGTDHVMMKQAAENRVAIEINLRQLLEHRGKIRSHILSHMRENVRLAQKFDTPVVAASGANTADYLRAPRELAAFPRMIGMDLEQSLETVSTVPRRMLQRTDRVNDDSTVQPGVRTVDDQAGDSGE